MSRIVNPMKNTTRNPTTSTMIKSLKRFTVHLLVYQCEYILAQVPTTAASHHGAMIHR